MSENGVRSKVSTNFMVAINPNHRFPVVENILNQGFYGQAK